MHQTINGFRLDFSGGAEHYLILSGDAIPIAEAELSTLELRMLSLHTIPGLAPLRAERQNLQVQLFYRITGKKPLSVWLQAHAPDLQNRSRLMFRMITLLEEGAGYLLTTDRYLLHENMIFVGEKPDDIAFIYMPLTRPSEIPSGVEALSRLATVLLDDHRTFIRGAAAGTGSLSEMKRLLQESLVYQSKDLSSSMDDVGRFNTSAEVAAVSTGSWSSHGSFVPPSLSWLNRIVYRMRRFWAESVTAPKPPLPELPLPFPDRYYEQLPAQTTLLSEPDATVLLDMEAAGRGPAVRLEWEEEGKPQIASISTERFMIGRAEEADLCPDIPGVSRSHAEVIEGGVLADLGSKNGTYLNEERLIPFKRYPLESGDRIRIAGGEYVYRKFPLA